MRIAFILPGFSAHPNDWAIPALLNLTQTLAQQHELYIFSQRYPAKGIYTFRGLTHIALGGGQNFGLASAKIWLQSRQAIIQQHQKTPFDLLHAFWADEAGFSAVMAGIHLQRPVIVSIGGGELTHLPNYGAQRFLTRRLTTRFALKKATIITAGSPYQLDLCRQHHLPEQKLRLAPLGVKTFPNYQSPNLHKQSVVSIIQAASLIPVKNQTLLLETLHLVKKSRPNIHLNLLGSGPLQIELLNLANRLKLSHNITWHGQIPYPDMPQLYQQSHLYLQTSEHESQGMAVLEAMACAVPVVGTPVGVVKTIACRPATFSAEVLAQQIIEILRDGPNYQQLRQQARQIIAENFSLPITVAKFLKIYKDTLNA